MSAQVEADTAGPRPEIVITTVDAEGENVTLVRLIGEIDLEVAPELRGGITKAIKRGARSMVFDLAQATFIDSTTLGVLVGGVKRLRPAGGSLTIVCADQNICKIFEITGLDRVFPIHGSREEALAALSSGAES